MIGTFMPWLDQARIAPFSLLPWAYIFFVVILPSTLVLCAIFFSVAALTRSFALTYAAAMAFFVAEVLLNLYAKLEIGRAPGLPWPIRRPGLPWRLRHATGRSPNSTQTFRWGLLLQNRLLWLTVALLALLLALLRFRLDLAEQAPFRFKRRTPGGATAQRTPQPAIQKITPVLSFSPRASFAQFVSQLKMDLSCVFKSPLIYIILALVITMMIGEFQSNVSRIGLETPLYPLTSQMLPILRFGMLPYILLIGLWYSAELIHRERASGIGEIINASPFPDWLMILSKTAALCLVVGCADARGSAHLNGDASSGRLHQLRAGPVSAIRVHLQRYLLLHAVHPGRGHSGDLAQQMAGYAADAGRLHRPVEPGTDGLRPCAVQLQHPRCRLLRYERLRPLHQTGVLVDRLLGGFLRPAAHCRASALPARQLFLRA